MLITSLCYSQGINKQTFDTLVDYVNCKYTAAYIKSLSTIPTEKDNIAKYNEKIKDKLESCTPKNPIEFLELSSLLKENGWRTTETKLVQKINNKKGLFLENEAINQVITKLVDTNILDSKFPNILKIAKIELEKELKALYSEEQLEEEKTEDKGVSQAVPPTVEPGGGSDGGSDGFISSIFWYILSLVGAIFILQFIVIWFRTSEERIKKITFNSERLENKFSLKSEAGFKQKADHPNYSELLTKIKEIEFKTQDLNRGLQKIQGQQIMIIAPEDKNQQQNQEQPRINNVKYLKTAPGGVFNNVFDNPSGCYFKLFNINGNNARFEFCGNIDEAIANRNAIFDETSEPFDPPKVANRILTIDPGCVVLQDSKWKITTRAKIKFE